MSGQMSPNLNPKTLDDLLANARHYAEYCMRSTGNLPPTLFLIGSDGKQVMLMPQNLADEKAKDDFATMSKLIWTKRHRARRLNHSPSSRGRRMRRLHHCMTGCR